VIDVRVLRTHRTSRPDGIAESSYVDRFACDWHRLVGRTSGGPDDRCQHR